MVVYNGFTMDTAHRHLLIVDAARRQFYLQLIDSSAPSRSATDALEMYFTLSGEALAHYLLRRRREALVLARGPLPYLAGNKLTVGYISPLTGVPHYSFVGGRGAAELFHLGLDAVVFINPVGEGRPPYVVISGQAPDIEVGFRPADELPQGQRSAYYWLLERECGGRRDGGSVFTLGEGAYHGYRTANLAVDAVYHAGRGGAGVVFARFASALVLRGEPLPPEEFFRGDPDFARDPNALIRPLLERYCARFMHPQGGTIPKLHATGGTAGGQPTLPAWNARRLGYPAADLGAPPVLRATRQGRMGCYWCPVDCRFWHWVPADYAPEGRDRFLDDFEPAYSTFAMLGLLPEDDSLQAKVRLRQEVDRRIILPIEQMGCDIMDIGLGLAALFEGLEAGAIPPAEVPPFLRQGECFGHMDRVEQAIALLREGAAGYLALRLVGDGPQALGERYPGLRDSVFTCGRGTLGNAGHCNQLWTFLMPFSRFFGHYVGQTYKIPGELPPPGDKKAAVSLFQRVIEEALEREYLSIVGNTLSLCAFVFVVFSVDGQGVRLDRHRLADLLARYGIYTTYQEMRWFAQAFWAQSIAFKGKCGWRPPTAADFPHRVFAALSLALHRPADELQELMALLIGEWKRQARAVLQKFGHPWPW